MEKQYTIGKLATGLTESLLGEKGFLYTLLQFLRRPGESLRSVLSGQIGKFNEPVRFLLYSVTLAALVMNLIGIGISEFDAPSIPEMRQTDQELHQLTVSMEELAKAEETNRELQFRVKRALVDLKQSRFEWQMGVFLQWINVTLLVAVPIYALGTFLFFPREMNFAEHIVLNSYIYGVQCCFSAVMAPIGLWDYLIYSSIYILIAQIYQLFAWHQILRFRTGWDWLKCGILVCGSVVVYMLVVAVMTAVFMILLLVFV